MIFNEKDDFYVKKNPKIYLITQFYLGKSKERTKELKDTFEHNLKNPDIDRIYLFIEKDYDYLEKFKTNRKLKIVKTYGKRLSFRVAFEYCNRIYKNKRKDIIFMVANSDMYFDKTLKKLYDYDFNKKILALSRINIVKDENGKDKWEYGAYGSTADTQDTWIWKNKITIKNIDKQYENRNNGIILGVGGCDNRIISIFQRSGYTVENKCKFLNTFHNHASQEREKNIFNGKPAYGGPYGHVECTK